MRPLLMYADRSLDPDEPLPWNESALHQDLGLDILYAAMAGGDRFILDLVSKVLLSARCNDVAALRYRQAAVRDSLDNPAAIRELYELAAGATENARRHHHIFRSRHPTSMLYEAIEAMREFLGSLRRLGDVARARRAGFASAPFRSLFDLVERELDAEYLARVEGHLKDLKFPRGLMLRAELGAGNRGSGYVLLESRRDDRPWFQRLFDQGPPGLSFSLDPRDEAGHSILHELRNRGIQSAARALARAVDQIGAFFQSLRVELGLLVGSLNLYERLSALGHRICFPTPLPAEQRGSSCRDLYDPSLALQMGRRTIGNRLDAEGKDLLIITGANRGGKSSFLRSLGVAQVMLQCGLFVPAGAFRGELCPSLVTHF
ncbi:MAG TPA: hypothetical protein VG963_06375, partial [Polyangiaceae bacterium]|nr:hypothetical protein [Polyangiaceae bacterium]